MELVYEDVSFVATLWESGEWEEAGGRKVFWASVLV